MPSTCISKFSVSLLALLLVFFSASLTNSFSVSSFFFLACSMATFRESCWHTGWLCYRMASQVKGSDCYEIHSFIRGYHAYKDVWIPKVGDILYMKCVPENEVDKNAVAMTTSSGKVGGHTPYNLALLLSQFLWRDFNKDTCEVTGDKLNRGAGYGIGISWIYSLYGPQSFIACLQTSVNNLQIKSLGVALYASVLRGAFICCENCVWLSAIWNIEVPLSEVLQCTIVQK